MKDYDYNPNYAFLGQIYRKENLEFNESGEIASEDMQLLQAIVEQMEAGGVWVDYYKDVEGQTNVVASEQIVAVDTDDGNSYTASVYDSKTPDDPDSLNHVRISMLNSQKREMRTITFAHFFGEVSREDTLRTNITDEEINTWRSRGGMNTVMTSGATTFFSEEVLAVAKDIGTGDINDSRIDNAVLFTRRKNKEDKSGIIVIPRPRHHY